MLSMMMSSQSFRVFANHACICMPDIKRAWWVPTAIFGVPVVPPENSMMAESSGLTITCGRDVPACLCSRSASHSVPRLQVNTVPFFFLFEQGE